MFGPNKPGEGADRSSVSGGFNLFPFDLVLDLGFTLFDPFFGLFVKRRMLVSFLTSADFLLARLAVVVDLVVDFFFDPMTFGIDFALVNLPLMLGILTLSDLIVLSDSFVLLGLLLTFASLCLLL